MVRSKMDGVRDMLLMYLRGAYFISQLFRGIVQRNIIIQVRILQAKVKTYYMGAKLSLTYHFYRWIHLSREG